MNDALIEQWTPKVYAMIRDCHINKEDTEDIAQELKLTIVKAANKFDDTLDISFHTYLHVAMLNTIRKYMNEKNKNIKTTGEDIFSSDSSQYLTSKKEDDILELPKTLTSGELIIIDFLMQGYKKNEIKKICINKPYEVEKIFKSLQQKLQGIRKEREEIWTY